MVLHTVKALRGWEAGCIQLYGMFILAYMVTGTHPFYVRASLLTT